MISIVKYQEYFTIDKEIIKIKSRWECFYMTKKAEKGMHEKAMKKTRNLLEQGVGITEIMDITGLSEEDILKEQQKMRR